MLQARERRESKHRGQRTQDSLSRPSMVSGKWKTSGTCLVGEKLRQDSEKLEFLGKWNADTETDR